MEATWIKNDLQRILKKVAETSLAIVNELIKSTPMTQEILGGKTYIKKHYNVN